VRHRLPRVALASVTTATLVTALACSSDPVSPGSVARAEVGQWATWVLPRGDVLRPPAPPADGSAQAAGETDEIIRLQSARTAVTDSLIQRYDGDPGVPWSRLAVGRLDLYWPLLPDVRVATPVRAARIMSLLHVAMHDAIVASWDAKYAYTRRSPAQASARIRALVPLGDVPSYPSEHAAVAAAAAMILTYAFPLEDTASFSRQAREAADSRIVAGAAYRSDVEAGWALGRAVAQRVLDRAMEDGSAQAWTGAVPTGEGMWQPTLPRRVQVPFDVTAGSWRTWVIPSGSAYRPGPAPVVGTPQFKADLNELLQLASGGRTPAQIDAARYWATDAPSIRWELFVEDEIASHRLSAPHAARARAYLSAAMYDAFIACWDTKFTYWVARPVTMDPTLKTVFSTPPFPSYPSGHSTQSSAAAEVMAELFPDRATFYRAKGEEASLSRVWAGVHYRFDVTTGEALGKRVGDAVVARMTGDGAKN
jgi:membrane-associated phospholipid phosphatase